MMSSQYIHICIFIIFFIGTSMLFRVIYRKHVMEAEAPTYTEGFVGQKEGVLSDIDGVAEMSMPSGAGKSELKRQIQRNRRRRPGRDSPYDDTSSSDGDETSSSDDDRYSNGETDTTSATSDENDGDTESEVENDRKRRESELDRKIAQTRSMSEYDTDTDSESEQKEKTKEAGGKSKSRRVNPEKKEYKENEMSRLLKEKADMKRDRRFYDDMLDGAFGQSRGDAVKDIKDAARDKMEVVREKVNRLFVNR